MLVVKNFVKLQLHEGSRPHCMEATIIIILYGVDAMDTLTKLTSTAS
jgi:hypothetical protein